jgi:hypothetical protein
MKFRIGFDLIEGEKKKTTIAVGLAYRGARPARLAMAQPIWAFRPEAESKGALSHIGTGGLPAKSGWSAAGGRGSSGRGASLGDGDSTGV